MGQFPPRVDIVDTHGGGGGQTASLPPQPGVGKCERRDKHVEGSHGLDAATTYDASVAAMATGEGPVVSRLTYEPYCAITGLYERGNQLRRRRQNNVQPMTPAAAVLLVPDGAF
ncbi:hypothetical protein AAHC03_0718 [Spirometra sp. Aus1]